MVRHLKAGNCLKIGNWSVLVFFGWHFVIVMRWEGREPFHSHAITPLGNNKAAISPTLRFAKVSSTKESARVYSVSPPGHLINDVVLGYSDIAILQPFSPVSPTYCSCIATHRVTSLISSDGISTERVRFPLQRRPLRQ